MLRRQTQKFRYCMIPVIWTVQKGQIYKVKYGFVVARGWGNWRMTAKGAEFLSRVTLLKTIDERN